MTFNPDIHHRRSIRLKEYDYSQLGLYFITIVLQNKECLLGEIVNGEMVFNDAGQMITRWYFELENKFSNAKCHDYIIMPNHIHAIIEIIENPTTMNTVGADLRVCPSDKSTEHIIGNQSEHRLEKQGEHAGSPLHRIVQWFKTMTTNEYIHRVKTGNWRPFFGKLWQRSYYDHIIRNENDLIRIREYIVQNPLKWENDTENPN
ncbi:transposase [Candidatus Latescibacterota bacterium]